MGVSVPVRRRSTYGGVLLDVAARCSDVLQDPAPDVDFVRFGQSSLDLELHAWIADPSRRDEITTVLHFAIRSAFLDEDIEIPFLSAELQLAPENDATPDASDQRQPAAGSARDRARPRRQLGSDTAVAPLVRRAKKSRRISADRAGVLRTRGRVLQGQDERYPFCGSPGALSVLAQRLRRPRRHRGRSVRSPAPGRRRGWPATRRDTRGAPADGRGGWSIDSSSRERARHPLVEKYDRPSWRSCACLCAALRSGSRRPAAPKRSTAAANRATDLRPPWLRKVRDEPGERVRLGRRHRHQLAAARPRSPCGQGSLLATVRSPLLRDAGDDIGDALEHRQEIAHPRRTRRR